MLSYPPVSFYDMCDKPIKVALSEQKQTHRNLPDFFSESVAKSMLLWALEDKAELAVEYRNARVQSTPTTKSLLLLCGCVTNVEIQSNKYPARCLSSAFRS